MRERGSPPIPPAPPPPAEKRWSSDDYYLSAIDSLTSDELRQKAVDLLAAARRQLDAGRAARRGHAPHRRPARRP